MDNKIKPSKNAVKTITGIIYVVIGIVVLFLLSLPGILGYNYAERMVQSTKAYCLTVESGIREVSPNPNSGQQAPETIKHCLDTLAPQILVWHISGVLGAYFFTIVILAIFVYTPYQIYLMARRRK